MPDYRKKAQPERVAYRMNYPMMHGLAQYFGGGAELPAKDYSRPGTGPMDARRQEAERRLRLMQIEADRRNAIEQARQVPMNPWEGVE